MTVTYILWVVLECIIFSVMVAGSGEASEMKIPTNRYIALYL